jgi:hypothetical protein
MRKSMAATALSFLLAIGGGAALADSSSSHADARANRAAPVGFAEEEVTSAPLTVESVDMKNRNLVLRAPDGTKSTVDIPAGTPGFDTLKKGDKVQLDYFEAAVFGPGNPQQSNRTSQTGNTTGTSSSNATGSSAPANANHGKVRNIRKVDGTGSTGHSASSGSDHGKR